MEVRRGIATNERRWSAAVAEHNRDVAAFVEAMRAVPADAWGREPAPGAWSPAELALHLCVSYEFGERAARTREGMRMRATPFQAWVSKRFILPLMVATGWWPGKVRAPREVRPDRDEAMRLSRDEALSRLQRTAAACIGALLEAAAADPPIRVQHAYFGPLTAYETARLLSLHTRHHTPRG